MNLNLDTIIPFVLLSIGYFITLFIIIAYDYKHIRNLQTNTFFLAKCIQAIACISFIFKGGNFDYIGVVLANSLLFISFSFEVIAIRELVKPLSKQSKIYYFIFTLISILGLHLLYIVDNNSNNITIYYAVVNVIIYSTVYKLIFGIGHTFLLRIVATIYVLFASISIIRGYLAVTTVSASSIFQAGDYHLIFLLSIFIFLNFSFIGYTLLSKQKIEKMMVYYASYDDLTHALNRRTFTNRCEEYLEQYAKKQQYVSYILFDVDHFKQINDQNGHHIGDLVLQDIAKKIQQQLGTDDLFGRYGGDEFAILLPGKDEQQSTQIANQILQAISEPNDLPVTYSISLGVLTIIPKANTPLQALYKNCDKALYSAKNNGRNGICRTNDRDVK